MPRRTPLYVSKGSKKDIIKGKFGRNDVNRSLCSSVDFPTMDPVYDNYALEKGEPYDSIDFDRDEKYKTRFDSIDHKILSCFC